MRGLCCVNGRTQPANRRLALLGGYPYEYYLPSTVVPIGQADGLLVGIRIVGRQYDDLTCLNIAALIEVNGSGFFGD